MLKKLAHLSVAVVAHEGPAAAGPDNVLIGEDGRVVLTDFGLALVDTDGSITSAARLGTLQYVAPESARFGVSTLESDLRSLSTTLTPPARVARRARAGAGVRLRRRCGPEDDFDFQPSRAFYDVVRATYQAYTSTS